MFVVPMVFLMAAAPERPQPPTVAAVRMVSVETILVGLRAKEDSSGAYVKAICRVSKEGTTTAVVLSDIGHPALTCEYTDAQARRLAATIDAALAAIEDGKDFPRTESVGVDVLTEGTGAGRRVKMLSNGLFTPSLTLNVADARSVADGLRRGPAVRAKLAACSVFSSMFTGK